MLRIALPIFLCLLIFSGCSKDDGDGACFNTVLSDFELDPESEAFQFYTDVEKVIYLDIEGNEHNFDKVHHFFSENSNYIQTSNCGVHTKSVKYKAPYELIRFCSPDSTKIAYTQQVVFLEEETDFESNKLVDFVSYAILDDRILNEQNFDFIKYFTSDRDGDINIDDVNAGIFTYWAEINLNGQTYQDVYEQINTGNGPMYFSKTFGLIGFNNISGVLLTFDRFE